MCIFFGILCLAAAVPLIFILGIENKNDENSNAIPHATAGAFIVVFIIAGIAIINEEYNPSITPMDVYQGKTTLQYKVVDGEKVDSCVIWKNK